MIISKLIKEAIDFHGHLGPYLILGLLSGEMLLKKTKAKKHFGLDIKVYGASKRPKSCLIDGLQLSTGATFGKGNIYKYNGNCIRIIGRNLKNDKIAELLFKPDLVKDLEGLKGHKDSEAFALKLLRINKTNLFQVKIKE
jgi:formylmethanofuran dehydrogenase subunit E